MLYFCKICVLLQFYTVNNTDDSSVAVNSPTQSHLNNSSVILIRQKLCKTGTVCARWKNGFVFEVQFDSEHNIPGRTLDIAMATPERLLRPTQELYSTAVLICSVHSLYCQG